MVWPYDLTFVPAAEAFPGGCGRDTEVVGTLSRVSPDSNPSSQGRGNPASEERESPLSNSCVRSMTPALSLENDDADEECPLGVRGSPRTLQAASMHGVRGAAPLDGR